MMAWNDSGEYVVAGTGEAYVGAVGATAPTTPTSSLSVASWTGLGYHTEDGVSISHSIEFGGGAITGSGPYTFTPADDDAALAEKSLVVDVKDGAYTLRFVVPRGTVVESVESQFARTQEAVLPITFEALEPTEGGPAWYFLTDAPGFAAGS
jgi:hypothetical protein